MILSWNFLSVSIATDYTVFALYDQIIIRYLMGNPSADHSSFMVWLVGHHVNDVNYTYIYSHSHCHILFDTMAILAYQYLTYLNIFSEPFTNSQIIKPSPVIFSAFIRICILY